MFNLTKYTLLFLALSSLTGCIISRPVNKTLSPPADTQWVDIEVKNPSAYTQPFPLEVRYISYDCLKTRISGADGSLVTEPSYNVIVIPMQQQGGGIWSGKVAITGGGLCKWTLSAINLGIEYTDATHLGKDLVPGATVAVRLAFDNDASGNGQFRISNGNLKLNPKYYPYIIEFNMSKNLKVLSFFGKDSFLSYRIINASHILFEPSLDENKIIRYIEPEKKIKGVYPKIIYPDGSVISDGTIIPDFDKIDKMQVK